MLTPSKGLLLAYLDRLHEQKQRNFAHAMIQTKSENRITRFRLSDPIDAVTTYFAETLWAADSVQKALGVLFPTAREYGIIHCHVDLVLRPLLSKLREQPSVADLIIEDDKDKFHLPESLLGSGRWVELAKIVNVELHRRFQDFGLLQKKGWRSPENELLPVEKLELKPLPIVPWLFFLASNARHEKFTKTLTASILAETLAADKGLPNWMRRKFCPQNCDRHLRRFRVASKTIETERRKRYEEAGGDGSQLAQSHPALAYMYPKGLNAFGATILDPETVGEIVEKFLPIAIFKKYHADLHGLELRITPKLPLHLVAKMGMLLGTMDPSSALALGLNDVDQPSSLPQFRPQSSVN